MAPCTVCRWSFTQSELPGQCLQLREAKMTANLRRALSNQRAVCTENTHTFYELISAIIKEAKFSKTTRRWWGFSPPLGPSQPASAVGEAARPLLSGTGLGCLHGRLHGQMCPTALQGKVNWNVPEISAMSANAQLLWETGDFGTRFQTQAIDVNTLGLQAYFLDLISVGTACQC